MLDALDGWVCMLVVRLCMCFFVRLCDTEKVQCLPYAVISVQILWALCVYLEAVSVLPQLRMMQKAKVVEKFTAHYVFALGISRFISCAHWILQIIDGDSFLLQAIGSGIWPAMVLLSEVVQTGILADFWYASFTLPCTDISLQVCVSVS